MNRLHIAVILILVSTLTNGEEPLIVAHRGASQDAPENTIPGFKLAWGQGADAIVRAISAKPKTDTLSVSMMQTRRESRIEILLSINHR